MVYLTRKEHFNAAHRLYNENWSEELNLQYFGKCMNKNFHGHNYTLYVTVKGKPNPETGFILNAKDLSIIIKEKVCDVLDHKNLNMQIPEFQKTLPSTENLCIYIWNILSQDINKDTLHCVKLYETDNIYAEYYGE